MQIAQPMRQVHSNGGAMTFQESIRVSLGKYADFSGTASRSVYWWFVLFLVLGGAVTSVLRAEYATIFFLVTLLPLLASGARRLHDTGRSGWLQLLGLIPVAGIFILALFLAQPGTETDRAEVPAST
jgi:uncharacterized membrane protein YhaH (DUF805 family)